MELQRRGGHLPQAVQELSARTLKIVCVGSCACFGGIPASGSNPTKAMGVCQCTGRPTINISGCPANPDWVVWALVQLLAGTPVKLDEDGRVEARYNRSFDGGEELPYIHDKCPRNPFNTGTPEAENFGEAGRCLINLGCRGPQTKARCDAAWCGIGGHKQGQPHPGAATSEALTEAPRGALGHWLAVSDSKIGKYQVVTPTCWNLSPKDDAGQREPLEQALIGLPVANLDEPIEVLRIVHSYDPCLDCATHVMRAEPGANVFTPGKTSFSNKATEA